ncbi:hypothetical protein HB837_15820 [Listeria innocua]|uniref:hypothetical protein n=1 Tax=Listeria innocua TaxID=1642 RepID=UPI00162735EE|nr:hypothetical protein [Listeria innocua]MBC1353874.1 hypothetical protein [Listeria innocua]
MIKKEIEQVKFTFDKETEDVTEKLSLKKKFFLFTLKTIRLYEEKTGRIFYEDYKKAFSSMTSKLNSAGIEFKEGANNENVDNSKMMDIMVDPYMNNFLIDLVPCLYIEFNEAGEVVQNEMTYDHAMSSDWITKLCTVEFFMQAFEEISTDAMGGMAKKQTANLAEKLQV